jgi:hypothetical protein
MPEGHRPVTDSDTGHHHDTMASKESIVNGKGLWIDLGERIRTFRRPAFGRYGGLHIVAKSERGA